MKVVLIYLGRRGVGPVYSLEVAKRLAKKCQFLAVVSQEIENLALWEKAGIPLFKMSTYQSNLGFFISLFRFKRFFSLYRQLKRFSPDVIYYTFFHFWNPLINLFLPRVAKVFTLHDPILHSGESSLLVELLQRLTIRQSKRIIILSKAFKNIVAQRAVPLENIDVIPLGICSDYAQIEREDREEDKVIADEGQLWPSGKPTLLFFGRILKYKGLSILLQAFPLIKKELPQAQLWLVGSGDLKPYQPFLKGLPDVKITNRWLKEEEISHYFTQADVLVCPYTDASQSGVIPVAYAFKMPAVASNVGGLSEQIDDKKTGLLVSANNPEALARACIEILKDPEKKQWLGEQGFKKAQTEWNWDIITEKVLESLKKAGKQVSR